jgi:glucose-1-phosphatase
MVCFDLGGVVVRICRSWDEACRAAGVRPRGTFDDQRNGDVSQLVRLHQTGLIDLPAFAERFSRTWNGRFSAEEITAIHLAWICGEYEGVGDLITRLNALDVHTAALSNTTAEHWAQLDQYAAFTHIRRRFGSHQLGLVKPDPEVYRAFERECGVKGEAIVFFDDLPENIAAAAERGWRAYPIDPDGCTATQISCALREHGIHV